MYMLAILLMLVWTSLIVEVKIKALMVNVYIYYKILLQNSSYNVTKKHIHSEVQNKKVKQHTDVWRNIRHKGMSHKRYNIIDTSLSSRKSGVLFFRIDKLWNEKDSINTGPWITARHTS